MPVKRCPLCHRANEATDWQCGKCGYEFGQSVDKAIEIVRDRLRTSRIVFWSLFVVDAGWAFAVWWGLMHGVVYFSIIGFILLSLWTGRSYAAGARAKASLRSLGAQQLPKATLRSG